MFTSFFLALSHQYKTPSATEVRFRAKQHRLQSLIRRFLLRWTPPLEALVTSSWWPFQTANCTYTYCSHKYLSGSQPQFLRNNSGGSNWAFSLQVRPVFWDITSLVLSTLILVVLGSLIIETWQGRPFPVSLLLQACPNPLTLVLGPSWLWWQYHLCASD